MKRTIISLVAALALAAPAFGQASVVAQTKAALGLTTNLSKEQINTLLRAVAVEVHGGILRKAGGNNCLGYSCDIICFADGRAFDVLGDSEGAASPAWNATTVDSSKCEILTGSAPPPPDPPASGGITQAQLDAALAQLRADVEREMHDMEARVTSNAVSDDRVKALIADAFAHVIVSGSTGRAWGHSHSIHVTLTPR